MNRLSEEGRVIRYMRLDVLKKVKENNYFRLSTPYTRFDPELVDREIRRKINNKRIKKEKYIKLMKSRGVFHA